MIKPKDLEPYGVTLEHLVPLKETLKKGDIIEANYKTPEEAVEA